jgi:signal peptidase II
MIVVLGTLFVLIVDQLTKLVVRLNFLPNQSIPVIPGIFHFTYVQNPGAAFGILPYQTTFFILVTLIIIGIVIYYSYKLRHTSALMLRLGLALQLGGALGNFLDRIRFSYVVDFFDFRIFPVFNVADIGIVLGVCLFAYQLLRLEN